MRKLLMFLILLVAMLGAETPNMLTSGIDMGNFDKTVRPQDDFYRYVNGSWLDKAEIPADMAMAGSFITLYQESQKNLRDIIEGAAKLKNRKGSELQQIGDLYTSFMDTVQLEKLGISPLKKEMKKVNSLKKKKDLPKLLAHLELIGVGKPVAFEIDQDLKESTEYILYISQGGLGLPDKDYYFLEGERFENTRKKYIEYTEKLLALAELDETADKAQRIYEIEKKIAEHHWSRVENRDMEKTYNKYTIDELNKLTPNFEWKNFLKGIGASKQKTVVVKQPNYIEYFNTMINEVSIEDWKTYLTFRLVKAFANNLSKDFVDVSFEFYGTTLSGMPVNRPRWKRGVGTVDGALGEVVGKIYVKRHFKPEAKARMVELVENLRTAFRERIQTLEWMGPETKKKALVKLEKFVPKIGYPDKWKDYSDLKIEKDKLVQNIIRANEFANKREFAKLGKPIDRSEWFMTPQTVNAYYNPMMNEIVFPAAILQPPFFNMEADDAVNYGGIGAVIGHEMSHGFDDQGSKTDEVGNMVDWWTKEDEEEFTNRGKVLIDQFSKYSPIDSMYVNGELTLGENIGDLGGLTISLHAYKNSLKGKEAPVIDDFTGTQRFFLGWAQVWRGKMREPMLRQIILTDPHSPNQYRGNGPLSNMPEFYKAFNVKEGDPMYRPKEIRAKIW